MKQSTKDAYDRLASGSVDPKDIKIILDYLSWQRAKTKNEHFTLISNCGILPT